MRCGENKIIPLMASMLPLAALASGQLLHAPDWWHQALLWVLLIGGGVLAVWLWCRYFKRELEAEQDRASFWRPMPLNGRRLRIPR